jgi:hypothetical protein
MNTILNLDEFSLILDEYKKPEGCICWHNDEGLLVNINPKCPEHQVLRKMVRHESNLHPSINFDDTTGEAPYGC